MRHLCLVFLLLTFGAGYAAEITGTVFYKAPLKGAVKAGYVAITSGGERISNFAGVTINAGAASATCTTYKPRNTSVSWDPEKGLSFRHTALPAGKYLIYFKYNERYLDWKVVNIASANVSMKTSMAISLQQASTLQFNLTTGTGHYRLRLLPLTDKGVSPLPGADLGFGMGLPIEADVQGKSVTFSQIKPGHYTVILERAESHGTKETGMYTTYTDLGTWDIVVKAGTGVRYSVP